MKGHRSIPALGAFFVLVALAVSACGSAVPSNSVAVVAGNPITTKAFNHWMYVEAKGQAAQSPGQPVIVPNDPPSFTKCIAQAKAAFPRLKNTPAKTLKADCDMLFKSLSGQVMGFLIQGYWYQAEAHKQGVTVSDAQVQSALAAAKQGRFSTAAQYQAFLTQSGQTPQDVLYEFRVNQVVAKLGKRQPTTVTPAEIAAYYAAHKSQYGTPAMRNMRIVLAKTSTQAAKAKAALAHGQSWRTVAKKYSTDPTTRNNGGLLTGVQPGQQDAALSKAAFAAPANKLQGPIKGQFGYYVLDVIKITPATQKSLAQSSATIKQTLTTQKQTAAQTAVNDRAKKDYLRRTKCRALYAMVDCSGYKAPKSPTTGAPGGSAGSAPPPSTTTSTTSSK